MECSLRQKLVADIYGHKTLNTVVGAARSPLGADGHPAGSPVLLLPLQGKRGSFDSVGFDSPSAACSSGPGNPFIFN